MMRLLSPLLAVLGMLLTPFPALTAASFAPGRGVNLDIWVTWPGPERWDEPSVLLPFPEWRQHLDSGDLDELRSVGFDTVRMPVDPAVFLSERTVPLRGDLLDSVEGSAHAILDAGLKVIVDLHAIPGSSAGRIGAERMVEDQAVFDRYVDVVRQFARRFDGAEPSRLALELMNEPALGCEGTDAALWQARLETLYTAARVAAPELTLVLSGACQGSADGLAAVDPGFADDNVLWTFHSYKPFILTHQGASWAGDVAPHLQAIPYPPYGGNSEAVEQALAATDRAVDRDASLLRRSAIKSYVREQVAIIDSPEKLEDELKQPFAVATDWASEHGIAASDLFLGEFGMIRNEWQTDIVMPPTSRAAYHRDVIGLAESYGFGWAIWGYGGAFGIVDAFDGERADPAVLDVVRSLPTEAMR